MKRKKPYWKPLAHLYCHDELKVLNLNIFWPFFASFVLMPMLCYSSLLRGMHRLSWLKICKTNCYIFLPKILLLSNFTIVTRRKDTSMSDSALGRILCSASEKNYWMTTLSTLKKMYIQYGTSGKRTGDMSYMFYLIKNYTLLIFIFGKEKCDIVLFLQSFCKIKVNAKK